MGTEEKEKCKVRALETTAFLDLHQSSLLLADLLDELRFLRLFLVWLGLGLRDVGDNTVPPTWVRLWVTENSEAEFEVWKRASDRFNINSQLEHLQAKYVGTGHADMNRFKMNLLEESATTLCSTSLTTPSSQDWKSIIRCYTNLHLSHQSLRAFNDMRANGYAPDCNTFPSVVKSCTALMDLKLGEAVHACVIHLGIEFDLYTGNALMNMYFKLQEKGYFRRGVEAVSRCDSCVGFDGFEKEFVGVDQNISIDCRMGGKNGVELKMESVRKVFDVMPVRDIVSWNIIIAGNARNGMYEEALIMVMEMGNASLKPDSFTLSSVLPIFAEYVDVCKGKEIHGYAIRHGFDSDVFIGSSLIDMYAKCTRIEDSLQTFHLLPQLDAISWNSVIAGCVQNGLFDEGLKLLRQMLIAKIKPKPVTFSSILPACAHLTTLNLGKQLHGYIVRIWFDDNEYIASALVHMYAKCGNIRIARWIFDKMESPDMVSWTAMIMGYALHGHGHKALSLFQQMEVENVRPNYVAFVAVLTACSHSGMVDEAQKYFTSMRHDYGIIPGLEHYAAVADLLGRVGKLEEAYELISSMDINPTGSVWSTLLSACRVHKNIDLAEKVAEKLFKLEPENMGAYVLLSNIYSSASRWRDAENTRIAMRGRGIRKKPACSWIEVKNKVHAFIAGDKSHPYYERINSVLKVLLKKMERGGYVPDTSDVFHDVEEEQKRYIV
ncbi:hypothetical protein GIB67_032357 [Kingdonia uniflora]|uniref:Pentatricopeptide repeat-containing protein n=1 Tax=Kingdonia uniflora TaxID=39325 RepID=A0A7J7MIJ0_9MAGN|nr:hypothetical protein GIB67_032357 [Kingdonia uniflora]